MAQVDILLAAYNGEKYIAEQLDSLLAQTFKDIRVVIRDDGSSDRTPEIIEQYAKKYPDVVEVVHDDAMCKYHAKNFFQLLKYAKADYVMFCDQDDHWLKWKVDITLDYMKKTERDNPDKGVVIFSGLRFADENMKDLDDSMGLNLEMSDYSFESLVVWNVATGCTFMINRNIYENIGEYEYYIDYHDYWIALYAGAFGAVRHIPMDLTLYRRHGDNATEDTKPRDRTPKLSRIPRFIKNLKKNIIKNHREFNICKYRYTGFLERYGMNLTKEQKQRLEDIFAMYGTSLTGRLKAAWKLKYLSHYGHLERLHILVSLITYRPAITGSVRRDKH